MRLGPAKGRYIGNDCDEERGISDLDQALVDPPKNIRLLR
jgi:hypothetical protein